MDSNQARNRKPQTGPSKMMRVAPTVTDPLMQSNRSQADAMLAEMGENTDGVQETVFSRKNPTKEELDQQQQAAPASTDNTMLIIIFALIVIALVAIIVWMITKQGSDKKEEEEIRRMIQPNQHSRNGMPPMNSYPVNQQQYNQMQMQRRQQQQRQQQSQQRRQQSQQQAQQNDGEDEDPEMEDDSEQQAPPAQQAPKPKPKAAGPNAAGTVVGATAEEKALSDKAEAEVEKPSNFTKENPHPGIIRPGAPVNAQVPLQTDGKALKPTSSVDDVMQRTEALLNAGNNAGPSNMTAADKALLDKVNREAEADDDDDDDEEDA